MNNLERNIKVFIKILNMVNDKNHPIILSGSTSLALQGVNIEVHDIDIVTDKEGAVLLDSLLKEYNINKMKYSETNTYKSYFGQYIIDDIKVEIMGEFQYKLKNGEWSKENHLHEIKYIEYDGVDIPVLSLEQEMIEYENTNRLQTVKKINEKIQKDR